MNNQYRLPESVSVGHVHLIVSDLERSLAFYRDILGFHVSEDMRTEPNPRKVVFLTANDADHHHVALMEMMMLQPYPQGGHFGLFHIPFLYSNRYYLAVALTSTPD